MTYFDGQVDYYHSRIKAEKAHLKALKKLAKLNNPILDNAKQVYPFVNPTIINWGHELVHVELSSRKDMEVLADYFTLLPVAKWVDGSIRRIEPYFAPSKESLDATLAKNTRREAVFRNGDMEIVNVADVYDFPFFLDGDKLTAFALSKTKHKFLFRISIKHEKGCKVDMAYSRFFKDIETAEKVLDMNFRKEQDNEAESEELQSDLIQATA